MPPVWSLFALSAGVFSLFRVYNEISGRFRRKMGLPVTAPSSTSSAA